MLALEPKPELVVATEAEAVAAAVIEAEVVIAIAIRLLAIAIGLLATKARTVIAFTLIIEPLAASTDSPQQDFSSMLGSTAPTAVATYSIA